LLTKSHQDFIGGAEVQQVLLGTGLSKENFDVSFIVADSGQPQNEVFNGIKIYKTLPLGYKIKSYKSLYKAFQVNWNVMKECNADVYYCRGASIYIGYVALFCIINRKKFILGMASDKDLITKLSKFLSIQNISFLIGLKFAHCVISQNRKQQNFLKKNFKIESIQINNMCHIPTEEPVTNKSNVLWVGTIKPEWKRPELFLKLAESIPEVHFQMIGGPAYGGPQSYFEFYEQIREKAHEITNLDFIGVVPYNKIDKYFESALIFVNTSSMEGFPNTFIQAWIKSVPVASLSVDPDEVICENNLGFHSKTFDQLVIDVNLLLDNSYLRGIFGNNARLYAEQEFDIKKIIKSYIKIIYQLLEISDEKN